MRIISVQHFVTFTKAPSPVAAPFDSFAVGYPELTKFIPNTSYYCSIATTV